MRLLLLIVLSLHMAFAWAAARPVGKNCSLAKPPPDAGEEMNHGFTMRVYPRAKDIPKTYSGCQAAWAPEKTGAWTLVALVEIRGGDPKRVWSPSSDPNQRKCRFNEGKVVSGDPEKCPDPKYLLMKSMAPGCVAKTSEAVEKNGLGAPKPAGCEKE